MALIGWLQAGPSKKPLLFWSCKQAKINVINLQYLECENYKIIEYFPKLLSIKNFSYLFYKYNFPFHQKLINIDHMNCSKKIGKQISPEARAALSLSIHHWKWR